MVQCAEALSQVLTWRHLALATAAVAAGASCLLYCLHQNSDSEPHSCPAIRGFQFPAHLEHPPRSCSPRCLQEGRERYVFFSFPHIAIDAKGMVGHISRPGRSSVSCACGALIKSLGEIKKQGIQGCRGENGGALPRHAWGARSLQGRGR